MANEGAKKKVIDTREVAIKVEGLSKTFKIPHEKHTSLKGAAVGLLNSGAKGYEVFHALNDINFEIKKGEFFGIIGRNGSGKSTLLKILAGIYVPDKGTGKITINGKLSPFLELGVGFNPELTGRENIFLGGTILGLSKKQVQEKYDQIVAFSELEEFIDMKLKNYSSGMQVRLAFSLSVNVHAEILLMDEVLAVGDTSFQAKCLKEFNKHKEQGKTVVLVSHDIGTIQRYCDRTLLLRNGNPVFLGDTETAIDMYMNQNIEDAASTPDGGRNDNGGGTERSVIISKVRVCDTSGKEKSGFIVNEDIVIEVGFKADSLSKMINIGIGVYDDNGTYAFGYNTQMDSHRVQGNSVRLRLSNPPLLGGLYHINVVAFGDVEASYYDFTTHISEFSIFAKAKDAKYRGLVRIKHEWL